ncbi:MAG: hypothetical protein OHK0022_29450 [Roseiflexaceae bacterium]
MNIARLIAPDFPLGKALISTKSLFEIAMLFAARPERESLRLASWILRLKPFYTMATNKNLVGLSRLVQRLDAMGLPGDIVECGVWNGGASAMMAATHLHGRGTASRTFWLYDSFEGLPPPSDKDGAATQAAFFEGWCVGDTGKARRALAMAGLPEERQRIVKGWFQDTLPHAPVEQIALLHVDADWYDSVMLALRTFYDRVTPGGVIVLNDYGYWQGCDRATHDFLAERGLSHIPIRQVDPQGGAFFQKPVERPAQARV